MYPSSHLTQTNMHSFPKSQIFLLDFRLYSLNEKTCGYWTISRVIAYSGFYHSCFLFFKKDVQWSFPVFHIKEKKIHFQTKHVSCQKLFHTTTSVIGRHIRDTRKGFLGDMLLGLGGGVGRSKCMTSCRPTFGTRIGLRAGVCRKKKVSGHILFNVLLQRVTKPSDWSCAAPVIKHR